MPASAAHGTWLRRRTAPVFGAGSGSSSPSSSPSRCRIGHSGRSSPAQQLINDFQRVGHLPHAFDALFQVDDVLLGQALDVGTVPRRIVPQAQQVGDFGHLEAEVARAADEAQAVDVRLRVRPVARLGAIRRRDQADLLVVADHLRRNAGRLGGLTDVHVMLLQRDAAGASTIGGWKRRRRSALPSTNTLDSAIAPAANTGDSSTPQTGYSTPAATGINAVL